MHEDVQSADLNQVLVARVPLYTDTDNPMLRIACRDASTIGASSVNPSASYTVTTNKYRTIQIAPASSGGSKLIILINVGVSSASYKQWQFSAYATGIADPDGVATGANLVHTQVTTLGALIKALRSIPLMDSMPGAVIQAYRLNASADYSLDTNDFAALAKCDLPSMTNPLDCLYRDASEIYTYAARIGFPAPYDGAKIAIVGVEAVATFASGTTTVTLATDPNDVANEEKTLFSDSSLATTVRKTLVDWSVRPRIYKGPILATIASGTVVLSAGELLVSYKNAQT